MAWLTGLGLLLPLCGTRTNVLVTPGMYVYFVPIYLAGMYFSRHYEACMTWVRSRIVFLGVWAAVFSVLLYAVRTGHLSWLAIVPLDSLHYVHKMLMICVFLCVLERYRHKRFPVLGLLAEYSFALYFLHTIVDVESLRLAVIHPFAQSPLVTVATLLYCCVCIAGTLALAMGIRRLTGRYSRLVIGV